MRVVLAGSHGLLGTALTGLLSQRGWSVQRLVRRPARSPREIPWDPAAGYLNPADLAGVDAVVNLGGASLAHLPWTAAYRRTILDSRTAPTTLLARTLATMADPPRVLLQASAVGYYGDRGAEVLTRGVDPGAPGSWPTSCAQWEAATAPAEQAGHPGGAPAHRLGRARQDRQRLVAADRDRHQARARRTAGTRDQLLELDHHGRPRRSRRAPAGRRRGGPGEPHRAEPGHPARGDRNPGACPAPARTGPGAGAGCCARLLHDVADELLLSSQRALPTVLESTGFTWQHPTIADAAAWLTARD